jgi:Glycosyl transferases group 1
MSLVLFHRNFQRMQGGHLKVFHYFEHVRSSPAHDAYIRFTPDSVWDESNPWFALGESVLAPSELSADVLFLAGMDWRALTPEQRDAPPKPIVNLIQYMPRAQRTGAMNQFLAHPAIRICVSPEIQEALQSTGTVAGPILTVPIGVDLERLPAPRPPEQRDLDCVVLAIKDPSLGQKVAERMVADGHRVRLIAEPVPRSELLDAMARARVTVHLPLMFEGAYLPALESMALGAAVVCPDCVGNRSFCRDGDTCLVPERKARALVKAARDLLDASPAELEPMRTRAREQTTRHTLAAERERFLEILGRVPELWAAL